jgi:hypothetical protein
MKGRIYKISCKTDPNLVYVGSTTQSLGQRLKVHKCHCRKMNHNAKLYQQINNNDWSNWKIELIEEVEFEDKNDLRKREGEYIRSIGTLNTLIAGRDMKEWCEDNKESIQEYQKQWYEDNKESILEYQKQYYENNKEKRKEHFKEYNQKNKEVMNKYRRNVRKANNHYRNTLLKKSFNAFKNHRDDLIVDCNIKK